MLFKEYLKYNSDNGNFTWIKPTSKRVCIGTKAGTLDKDGYCVIKFNYKLYRAHRLAWFYMYDVWPSQQIDHIDGNKLNNSITNLRDVNSQTNMENIKNVGRSNTSGMLGVSFHKHKKKYMANIKVNKKTMYLGSFNKAEDAQSAYLKYKQQYHAGYIP